MSVQKNDLSYCGALIRAHDPDRFLQSMFFAPDVREYLWALFAFNHEIAKTREVVSESTLGLIRLQWWRDAIQDIYEHDKVTEHEVIKPLAKAISEHDLLREYFDQLLYAREFDLEDVLPSNMEGLMNYADFTTQPLFKLALKITGTDPEGEIVQPVAINYALAGILRASGALARQHRFYLPEDLMNKHAVSKEDFFEDKTRKPLKALTKEIVEARLKKSKPEHIFLKSAEAISEIYFKQIKSLDYDVLSPAITRDPAFKVFRVFWKTKIL